MTIFLSMSGVLFDWITSARKACGMDLHKFKDSLSSVVGKRKIWKIIDDLGVDFWANLEPHPWCADLWDYACQLAASNVYVCSSPSDKPESACGQIIAIQKHLQTQRYVITPHKQLCATSFSLLVDDNLKQVHQFEDAGGITYLWPHDKVVYEKAKADIGELVCFHKLLQRG